MQKVRGNDWDRRGLPAWTYHSEALLELEKEEIFLTHWQIAGHVNDAPNPGDFFTFDMFGERALVVRGNDGELRAFHNLCRHRGSRVVAGERGHCRNALVCPFHGWVYNLDGSLRGAARPESYAAIDRSTLGLRPVEMEIWMGLVFLRFKKGPQPAVRETLASFAAEIEALRPHDMVPSGNVWDARLAVNWKSMADVDNEGYHVAMAHPALQDLYGHTYRDYPAEAGLSLAKGTFENGIGRRWSVRNYLKLAGGPQWLPEKARHSWAYYGLFPNNVIVATPETLQFYQELPEGVSMARMRGAIYRRADESRAERLARYLSYRIDRDTYEEDTQLSIWSNESMKSSAFDGFYLSDLERGVRSHHDQLRALLPVMTLDQPPPGRDLASLNAELRNKVN